MAPRLAGIAEAYHEMRQFASEVTSGSDRATALTMNDFDRLLQAAHDRRLKLLLDFVSTHSSDQHPWFAARAIAASCAETESAASCR